MEDRGNLTTTHTSQPSSLAESPQPIPGQFQTLASSNSNQENISPELRNAIQFSLVGNLN
jgi:hypothetical protein